MAQTTDISKLKHVLVNAPLHFYIEEPADGSAPVVRHIRVNQRTFGVPTEGITIDDLPPDIIGTEQIKDGTVGMDDLSQAAKGSLVSASEKGASGGIATLGGDGKVPASQLPETAVATESDVRGIVSGYES